MKKIIQLFSENAAEIIFIVTIMAVCSYIPLLILPNNVFLRTLLKIEVFVIIVGSFLITVIPIFSWLQIFWNKRKSNNNK